MAIAASMNIAALGYVNSAMTKNDARPRGALAAALENKYSPNPVVAPENKQVKVPGMTPAEASA